LIGGENVDEPCKGDTFS